MTEFEFTRPVEDEGAFPDVPSKAPEYVKRDKRSPFAWVTENKHATIIKILFATCVFLFLLGAALFIVSMGGPVWKRFAIVGGLVGIVILSLIWTYALAER